MIGLGGIAWTAIGCMASLAVTLAAVLIDDWRWHRDNNRAVRRRLDEIGREAPDTPWGDVVSLHPEARFSHHGAERNR